MNNAVVGESLPDVSAFGNDLYTGVATVGYPFEVPPGPGGMKPSLGLNYASSTVDTFRWDNYKNTNTGYRVQAGIAGLGWDLSGMSYIAFLTEGEDPNSTSDNLYSFVLNGTSNVFKEGQTLTESFAKIEKNLQTVITSNRKVVSTGEWTVTTADGTKHYFGGAAISPVTASGASNQGVMLWNPGDGNTYRVVNKWYLRKSVDPHVNYIEYNYTSIPRDMSCSTNSNYNPGWYYRSIRPASIVWGGNEQTGLGHQMRVLFSYESRTDYQIYQYSNVCSQSMYSTDRLKTIRVEAYSEGAWRPQREYELSYSYSAGYHQHSWLNTIKHYGFTGAGARTTNPLNTNTFDYTIGAIHSEVYLLRAFNGWGGRVDYTYAVPTTTGCYIDHNQGTGVTTTQCDTHPYRRQVVGRRVYDGYNGAGNWVHTYYAYGAGLYRVFENDPEEFLGYPFAASITYAQNSMATEAQVTEHWFYRNNGFTADADIANNPDPRLGRIDYERVVQPGTVGCPTAQILDYGTIQRCKMAETDNVYTALTGSGASWSATNSYTVRPRWVRLDSVVNWADGAALAKVFSYDTAKQNNTQFGNVTKVQERDGSTSGTLQRWTETEYYPNTSAHVVNLPARMQVYDASNNCKAETRNIYGAYYSGSTYVSNVDSHYQTAPYNSRLVKQEVALSGCSSTLSINTYDSGWAVTRYAYDAYGNRTTENRTGASSSNNLIVSTQFDSTYHFFPILDSVNYDEAGRLRTLRLPQGNTTPGDDLWRSFYYFPWTGTDGNSNGRLWYIGVGTSANGFDRMLLDYRYDSFGNVSQYNPNQGVWNSFTYDAQNRVTSGYGRSYSYDAAGRITNYENAAQTVNSSFPGHAIKNSGYSYDANGNALTRANGQTLTWDHENRLSTVTGSGVNESYLYDADGQRVRKTSNGVNTYYPNQYYEQTGSIITKYYYLNGQRVAMRTNASGSWAHYDLHSDHLGSPVFVTTQGGATHSSEGYYVYGRNRTGDIGLTDHKFTGQKLDGTGLQYFNARYYDPAIGAFISPDTLVPDRYLIIRYPQSKKGLRKRCATPFELSTTHGLLGLCR